MRKVIKKAGVFALTATLVLTGIALPVKEKAVAETKDYGISNPRVEFLERECVFFGNYWQKDTNNDGVADQKDDKTPIKWQVLDKVNGEVILLSEQILDIQDYDNENTENANKLEITPDSKFTVELADGTGYTISYLKSKVKKNDPPATTTENKEDTGPTTNKTPTPAADKEIKFKQNRKKVKAGNGYLFSVVSKDGSWGNGEDDQSKVICR